MWKGVPLLVSICLLCCQAALGHDKYAYIAFVNDVHNRIEEEDPTTSTPCSPKAQAAGTCVGGWPRISSAVKSLRLQAQKEGAAFFFLDAGDEFTGTMWDAVYQGQTVAPLLLNKVKPDVMTLGNHEFDFGPQTLGSFISNLTFPMLGACNIDTSGEPALQDKLKQYTVLQYKKYKIGVIGWITPTTGETSRDVGGVKFTPIVPSVKACLSIMKKEQPDLDFIIGLSHSGYDEDLIAAREVEGVDVIVGGHSHTFLYTPVTAGPIVARGPGINASNCVAKGACDRPLGPYPTLANRTHTPIVQAYYSSKYLGLLKINLSKRRLVPGVLPLLLGGANSSNNVQQDPELLGIIQKYRAPVDELQTQIAGKTLVPLEGDASSSRVNETNLGNYVCDAFLRSVPKAVAAKAPGGNVTICMFNAGGIRTGYKLTGDLTVGTVLTMLPYANAVSIFTVKGSVLIAAVKNGLSAFPNGGRFLQVAGLRYYHSAGVYQSAVLLNPDGSTTPINPSQQYTIVSTDYMLQGGDGFKFTEAEVLLPAGLPYAQQVIVDLKLFPQGIAPVTENRIIDCAKWPQFAGCPAATSTVSSKPQKRFSRYL